MLKKLELTWWQAAIYEIGMISLGIVIGARFLGYFEGVVGIFLIIFILCASYITYLWFNQASTKPKSGKSKSNLV